MVVKALDDHSGEAEPPASGEVRAADATPDGDDEDSGASHWTGAFIAARADDLADTMLDDVLSAARDAAVDEQGVRRALRTMGVRTRRDGTLGRRKQKARHGEGAAPLAPAESRSERRSNRAPGGKVHILAVDLDSDGQVDTLEPMSIVVRIRCDEPGRLHARLLVRDGQRGELEAVAPGRDVAHPGLYALRCDIPADALGGLKHAVDVEAWLATAGETYASLHLSAQRFKSRERSRHRPFVQLDDSWSEESL